MIEFSPCHGRVTLSNDQLSTVYRLSRGNDAEVVDHESNTLITVYIDDLRYIVQEDGQVIGVERGVETEGDWEWTDIRNPEHELGYVFKDGTVTVRLIGEPGKTMGHEDGRGDPDLQAFFVSAMVTLVDRISTGRYDDICVDYIPDVEGESPDLLCNVSYGGYHDA